MQGIYVYIEPGKHIYRLYIYVFHIYLCIYMQFSCCIYANECKLMQMYALLHIINYLIITSFTRSTKGMMMSKKYS